MDRVHDFRAAFFDRFLAEAHPVAVLGGLAIAMALALAALPLVPSFAICGACLAVAVAVAPPQVVPPLRRLLAMGLAILILLVPALAQAQAVPPASATSIDLGGIWADIRGPLETLLYTVVGLILAALSWLAKRNLGVSIDEKYRRIAQDTIANGVHAGLDYVDASLEGRTLDLRSEIAARAVTYAHDFAKDAIRHLKLSDEDLAQMARAELAKLLPAEVVAAVATPAAPASGA